MNLPSTLGLTALLFASSIASAQTSTKGHADLAARGESIRLTITGPAAAALYDILVKKEGATLRECEIGSSVEADAFACNRRPDGSSSCTTSTSTQPDDFTFTPVDLCLQPQHSIIGVGNIREAEDEPAVKPFIGGTKPFKPRIELPGIKPRVPPCLPIPSAL